MAAMRFGSKALASSWTAVRLVAVPTKARALWVQAKKVTGANIAAIFITDSTGTRFGGLLKGEYLEMPLGGAVINLMDIWITGGYVADGVVFGYIAV